MQLKLSKDDIGFRDEVRQFIADELPHDTQRRMHNGLGAQQRGSRRLASQALQTRLVVPALAGRIGGV